MQMALQASESKPGKARRMRWLRKPIAPLCHEERVRLLEIQCQFTNRDTPICEVEEQKMPHKNHSKMHRPNAPKEQIITTDPKSSLPNQEPNRPDPPRQRTPQINSQQPQMRWRKMTDRGAQGGKTRTSLPTAPWSTTVAQQPTRPESQKPNQERKDEIGELCVPAWDKKKEDRLLKRRRRRKLRCRCQWPAHKAPWPPQSPVPPPQAKGKNPRAVRLSVRVGDLVSNLIPPPSTMTGGPTFFSFPFLLFSNWEINKWPSDYNNFIPTSVTKSQNQPAKAVGS